VNVVVAGAVSIFGKTVMLLVRYVGTLSPFRSISKVYEPVIIKLTET